MQYEYLANKEKKINPFLAEEMKLNPSQTLNGGKDDLEVLFLWMDWVLERFMWKIYKKRVDYVVQVWEEDGCKNQLMPFAKFRQSWNSESHGGIFLKKGKWKFKYSFVSVNLFFRGVTIRIAANKKLGLKGIGRFWLIK